MFWLGNELDLNLATRNRLKNSFRLSLKRLKMAKKKAMKGLKKAREWKLNKEKY